MGCRRGYSGRVYYNVRRFLAWIASDKLLLSLATGYLIVSILSPGFPRRSIHYADYRAIATIASLMAGSLLLEASGLFQETARKIVSGRRGRIAVSAFTLVVIASSLIVLNDAMIFIAVPLAVALARQSGTDKRLLVPLAITAVNLGSSASPVGNPQNIIIWHYYNLTPARFLSFTLPVYAAPFAILLAYSYLSSPRTRAPRTSVPIFVDRRAASLGTASIVVTVVLAGFGRPYYVLLFSLGALAVYPRLAAGYDLRVPLDIWLAYTVLRGASQLLSLKPYTGFEAYLAGFLASQAISNVPATILLLGSSWKPLQLGVNLGGIPLPQSSIANLVGLRIAGVSARDYVRTVLIVSITFFAYGLAVSLAISG